MENAQTLDNFLITNKNVQQTFSTYKKQLSEVNVKHGDERWNGAVGNLNGVKPNEWVVKCSWVKFKWEEAKCRQV
jgi:hypothetical protein